MRRFCFITFTLVLSGYLYGQNVNKVEYFIDTDPGFGSATNVLITPGLLVTKSFNATTSGLPVGFHTIVIRAQDMNNLWGIQDTRSFFISASNLTTTANVVAMEYFIDTDPGTGVATAFPITASTVINLSTLVPANTLPAGFHTLYVRTLDSDGIWGVPDSRTFFVSTSNLSTTANIVAIEYFFDSDPGTGNGTPITITAAPTIDVNALITANTLPAGFHTINIRALDSDGIWGNLSSRSFFVDAFAKAKLAGVEYFIDTDPGIGNGGLLPVAPSQDTIDRVVNLPTNTLTNGAYTVGMRVVNDNGTYGQTYYANFTVCSTASADFLSDVVCIGGTTSFTDNSLNVLVGDTYSWDFDGDAIPDATTAGNQSFTYPATGTYNATLSIDRSGCTSIITLPVQVEPIPVANAGLDQTVCTTSATLAGSALGANETGQWQLVTGSATITTPTAPLSTLTAMTTETVELSWTVTNSLGGCNSVDNVIITTSGLLNASISATSVCQGTITDFTDNSTNTKLGDVYAWDFDGDAIIDATTAGNQTFMFASSGTYNATLSIDRGGCISTSTVVVDVYALPVVNAGLDQSVCSQSATFAATALGINETGVWTLLNGAATIANMNDPLSTTTISSGTAEFIWTVTNMVTGCVTADTVLISANQPITANAASGTVDIGQSINIDVQSAATTNPGDVLTTTIVTQPTSGTTTVLADGTIDYTPDAGATGSDTFTFRITNQCNNFSENTTTITINNAPPTIAPPIVTPPVNSQTVTIDLSVLISDPNNNVDLSSLAIVSQPISGATASIDAAGNVTIDYTGITFTGQDMFDVTVCDLSGACSTQTITIDGVNVGLENPPLTVYNAVSPNGDGYHDFLEIENIEFYSGNVVIILNRWGSEVDKIQGYNNQDKVFRGNGLPSGVYYYVIQPGPGSSDISGDFVLKLDN